MKNPPAMPHSMYKSNSPHNHDFKLYFDINAKTTEFFKKNNCTNITYIPIVTPPTSTCHHTSFSQKQYTIYKKGTSNIYPFKTPKKRRKGKCTLNSFDINFWESTNIKVSDNNQHTEDPTPCHLGTNNTFKEIPNNAPIKEFFKITLSSFKGISACMTKICSYPIINIKGATICNKKTAPSYSFPEIK